MKIFSRKKPNPCRKYQSLGSMLAPLWEKIRSYTKLGARIKLANRWCKKNPKKMMTLYFVIAVALISITLMPISFVTPLESNEDSLRIKRMTAINRNFDYVRQKEMNDRLIREQLGKLGEMGFHLANELDSLMKLENKTNQDSLRIQSLYNTLQTTFKFETTHESKSQKN